MEYGLFMMPLHPPEKSITETLDEDLATIVLADKLGYREVWIGEHYTAAWENIPAPDQLMAKAIPLTERIVFGTGVACLAYQHPFIIAHRMATFDHLAKGRFALGIGPGSLATDLNTFGLEIDEARDRAREAIQLIMQVWQSTGEFAFHGKYWQVHPSQCHRFPGTGLFLKPYQQPHPPIAVAGSSPNSKTLEIAGRNGWIPMSINFIPAEGLRSQWASVEGAARQAGRAPSRSQWRVSREVYVAPTNEEAREQALENGMGRAFDEYMRPLIKNARGLGHLKRPGDETPDDEIHSPWMLDNLWIVGDPDTVAAKLRGLYDDVGGFGTLLVIGHDMPTALWERSLTLLANEVMPQLTTLTGDEPVAGRAG